jgi:hypothetical protein
MRYLIKEISTIDTINDGIVLLVKATSVDNSSEIEYRDNVSFAFPYSEQLFTQLSQTSNNHKYWEPYEEEFVEDSIEDQKGEVIDVYAYTGGFNLQIAYSTGYTAGLDE